MATYDLYIDDTFVGTFTDQEYKEEINKYIEEIKINQNKEIYQKIHDNVIELYITHIKFFKKKIHTIKFVKQYSFDKEIIIDNKFCIIISNYDRNALINLLKKANLILEDLNLLLYSL